MEAIGGALPILQFLLQELFRNIISNRWVLGKITKDTDLEGLEGSLKSSRIF